MVERATFLVFGATGQTGQHFVRLALKEGHRVRALARTPAKLAIESAALEVHPGSITEVADLDELVRGVDYVVCMLGDKAMQQTARINTAFVKKLVPAMRRQGVKRLLYQAGGLTTPYKGKLSAVFWLIRQTVGRSFIGQHKDNEAVLAYLVEEADDIEWMVHRAGIGSDGASKGRLQRSSSKVSIATFVDCAEYSYRTVMDAAAIHTCDLSCYERK